MADSAPVAPDATSVQPSDKSDGVEGLQNGHAAATTEDLPQDGVTPASIWAHALRSVTMLLADPSAPTNPDLARRASTIVELAAYPEGAEAQLLSVLEQIMTWAAAAISRGDPAVAQVLSAVLSERATFFNHFGHAVASAAREPEALAAEPVLSESDKAMRQGFMEGWQEYICDGDFVDYFDPLFQQWTPAYVLNASEDSFSVRTSAALAPRSVGKQSIAVAPSGTFSELQRHRDVEWRKSLGIGSDLAFIRMLGGELKRTRGRVVSVGTCGAVGCPQCKLLIQFEGSEGGMWTERNSQNLYPDVASADAPPPAADPTDAYAAHRSFKTRSVHFAHLINVFGNANGFVNLLSYLHRVGKGATAPTGISALLGSASSDCTLPLQVPEDGPEAAWSLPSLLAMCGLVNHMAPHLCKPFLSAFIPQFVLHTVTAVSKCTVADLRSLDDDALEPLVATLAQLLTPLYRAPQVQTFRVHACLAIGLLHFQVPVLKQQLRGLEFMTSVADFQNTPDFMEAVGAWLHESRVLDTIFGRGTHFEVVKRSASLLRLLLRAHLLTVDHLSMIWNARLHSDEATILSVLTNLHAWCTAEHVDYISRLLIATDPRSITPALLDFAKGICRYAPVDRQDSADRTLQWLQQLLLDESVNRQLPENVRAVLVAKLDDIFKLRLVSLEKAFNAFVDQCCDALHRRTAVDQAFSMLTRIVQWSPPNTMNRVALDNQINLLTRLVTEHKLLQVTLTELTETKAKFAAPSMIRSPSLARATSKRVPSGSPSDAPDSLSRSMSREDSLLNDGWVSGLRLRLQFITLLSTRTGLRLSVQETHSLWTSCVHSPLCEAETHAFLNWMEFGLDQTPDNCMFDPAVGTALFSKFFVEPVTGAPIDQSPPLEDDGHVASLDAVLSLPVERFGILRNLFLRANANAHKIVSRFVGEHGALGHIRIAARPSMFNRFAVVDHRLIGLTVLWKLAVEAESGTVADKAAQLLLSLPHNASAELRPVVDLIRGSYTDQCMAFLSSAADPVQQARCLRILGMILDESERHGVRGLRSHEHTAPGVRFTLRLDQDTEESPNNLVVDMNRLGMNTVSSRSSVAQVNTFTLDVRDLDTVWDVREAVASKANVPASDIRLKFRGRVLEDSDNPHTLREMGIGNNDKFVFSHFIAEPPISLLLEPSLDVTPAFFGALSRMFDDFASSPVGMAAADIARYFQSCNVPADSWAPHRLQEVLRDYESVMGPDNERRLTRAGFIKFYAVAAHNHGYDFDLQHISQVRTQQEAALATYGDLSEQFPRRRLAYTWSYFQTLLTLASSAEAEVSALAWCLLMRIPTSPEYLASVRELDGFSKPDLSWQSLMQVSSTHKLLYCLHIMHVFMYSQALPAEADAPWAQRMLSCGGFEYIYATFFELIGLQQSSTDLLMTECLAGCLEVVQYFVVGAMAAIQPSMVDFMARTSAMANVDTSLVTSVLSKPHKVGDESADASSSADAEIPASSSPSAVPSSFLVLVRQLSGDETYAQRLLATVNFEQLAEKLLSLIQVTMQEGGTSSHSLLFESAAALWVACLVHSPALYHAFVEGDAQSAARLVKSVILHCTSAETRTAAASTLALLSNKLLDETPSPRSFLLSVLVEAIPAVIEGQSSAVGAQSQQFFELLAAVAAQSLIGSGSDADVAGRAGLQALTAALDLPMLESDCDGAVDHVLVGLLHLAATVMERNSRPILDAAAAVDTVGQLFEMLFASPDLAGEPVLPTPPKCKTTVSRAAAFRVVRAILATVDSLDVMEAVNKGVHRASKISDDSMPPAGRASCGFAGLVNMGTTCYMNSVLQQLFMLPEFRSQILAAPAPADQTNVLYQLQVLFAHLADTRRQAHHPRAFVGNYIDPETGQPVNCRVQQDATEFFNVLSDRIENQLKGTPQEKLLRNTFEGTAATQLVCKGCGSVRDRPPEGFYCLSVDVSHNKGLFDALDKFVQGDLLTDFKCEACSQTVETQKRNVLVSLPDTLFVQLKRFEFNYTTFVREKLNDRFEFPFELSLADFTKEGVAAKAAASSSVSTTSDSAAVDPTADSAVGGSQDAGAASHADAHLLPHPHEYYEYDLSGILIHQGTAEAGHYYSFIRVPDASGEWLEFNDTTVRPISRSQMEDQAFGDAAPEGGAAGMRARGLMSLFSSRMCSAYMLVYRRRSLPAQDTETSVPRSIAKLVWQDNMHFMMQRFVTEPALRDLGLQLSGQVLRAVSQEWNARTEGYFAEYLPVLATRRWAQHAVFGAQVQLLQQICAAHVPAALKFLEFMCPATIKGNDALRYLCLEHTSDLVRCQFQDLVLTALKAVYPMQRGAVADDAPAFIPATVMASSASRLVLPPPRTEPAVTYVGRVLEVYMPAFEAGMVVKQQVWDAVSGIAGFGPEARELLIKRGMVTNIIEQLQTLWVHVLDARVLGRGRVLIQGEVLLNADSSMPLDTTKFVAYKNTFVCVYRLLRDLVVLLRTPMMQMGNLPATTARPPTLVGEGVVLAAADHRQLRSKQVYDMSVWDPTLIELVSDVLLHWMWEWTDFSSSGCHMLLEWYTARDDTVLDAVTALALRVLDMDDSLRMQRVNQLLFVGASNVRGLFTVLLARPAAPSTVRVLQALLSWAATSTFARSTFAAKRHMWKWIIEGAASQALAEAPEGSTVVAAASRFWAELDAEFGPAAEPEASEAEAIFTSRPEAPVPTAPTGVADSTGEPPAADAVDTNADTSPFANKRRHLAHPDSEGEPYDLDITARPTTPPNPPRRVVASDMDDNTQFVSIDPSSLMAAGLDSAALMRLLYQHGIAFVEPMEDDDMGDDHDDDAGTGGAGGGGGGASGGASGSASVWVCSRCTVENPNAVRHCFVCGAMK